MSTAAKVWLVIAIVLVLVGSMILGGVWLALNGDFLKLSTVNYETNRYEIKEPYKNISIAVDTADMELIPSEDGTSTVVCYEEKKVRHSVSVQDGTLVIKTEDTRKWYERIGLNFGTPKITIAVPGGAYGRLKVRASTGDLTVAEAFHFEGMDVEESTGDVRNKASVSDLLKIKTSTGAIRLENPTAGSLDLTVSTGKITAAGMNCSGDVKIGVSTGKTELTDLTCKNLITNGSTGDVTFKNVLATGALSIERSTGHVKLEGCDAGSISIHTDTGDVKGSLRSEKIFFAESDTGDVDVPKTMTGGKCEVTTSTGDIKLEVLS